MLQPELARIHVSQKEVLALTGFYPDIWGKWGRQVDPAGPVGSWWAVVGGREVNSVEWQSYSQHWLHRCRSFVEGKRGEVLLLSRW